MADEQRIAVLEQHVRALYEQLAALRIELRAGDGASWSAREVGIPPQPELPQDAPPSLSLPREAPRYRTNPHIDLEKLLGRYGSIAVASLAILMGVGTFLSWAIEHGHLGPTVRVILGFIGAGIVAGAGIWVREKRDVRFGNVLLALALAIVHVDAWAAGPRLQVLSTISALAIAATASAALAALALTSEARTLFAIGFAGALIAPFITAREPGSVVMLLTYGWVVIAIGLFAIREKGWRPMLWLTVIAGAGYLFAAIGAGPGQDRSWFAAHAPVLFAFACAASGLLFARDSLRSKLGLAFLLLACLATIVQSVASTQLEVSASLLGTGAAYLIARELETDTKWLVIGNVILPLGFLLATVISTSDKPTAALAAAAFAVVAAVLSLEDEEERPHHLFVAAIASGASIFLYLFELDTRCIAALALHAALFSTILRATRARLLVLPIVIGLVIASLWAYSLLVNRSIYAYTPFLTVASVCAFATVISWALLAFAVKPMAEERSLEDAQLSSLMSVFAMIVAFTWVRQELVGAWSRDAASFALIVYYALVGLALIFAGRFRRVGLWRATGLALAFYAGYKALAETFTIDAIGLRVGARILVGVFLAAVAYWYRVPSDPPAEAPLAAAPPAGDGQAPEPL